MSQPVFDIIGILSGLNNIFQVFYLNCISEGVQIRIDILSKRATPLVCAQTVKIGDLDLSVPLGELMKVP